GRSRPGNIRSPCCRPVKPYKPPSTWDCVPRTRSTAHYAVRFSWTNGASASATLLTTSPNPCPASTRHGWAHSWTAAPALTPAAPTDGNAPTVRSKEARASGPPTVHTRPTPASTTSTNSPPTTPAGPTNSAPNWRDLSGGPAVTPAILTTGHRRMDASIASVKQSRP